MLDGILMIVGGAIAAMSLIAKKSANAEDVLKKIVPFQGYLGVVLFIWGIWGLIRSILGIGILGTWPLWWITLLLVAVVETVLGFMLGFGLISKYALSKNEEAQKKGDEILAKLAVYQTNLGLIGIAVGVWTIIYYILIF